MRDCMRRYRQKGGKVTTYTTRTLPDGREVLVPNKVEKSGAAKGLKKHLGPYGEVMDECPCTECQAAGMTMPAPKAEDSSKLRSMAKAKVEKLHDKAKAAISDCKWAMTACIVRRSGGTTYGPIRRKHNARSLKARTAARRAVATYKNAHARFNAAFGS